MTKVENEKQQARDRIIALKQQLKEAHSATIGIPQDRDILQMQEEAERSVTAASSEELQERGRAQVKRLRSVMSTLQDNMISAERDRSRSVRRDQEVDLTKHPQ